MIIQKPSSKRSTVIFPKNQEILTGLGETIKIARLRRNYSEVLISERTRLSCFTIRKIEYGDAKVSLDRYVTVPSVLGSAEGLAMEVIVFFQLEKAEAEKIKEEVFLPSSSGEKLPQIWELVAQSNSL